MKKQSTLTAKRRSCLLLTATACCLLLLALPLPLAAQLSEESSVICASETFTITGPDPVGAGTPATYSWRRDIDATALGSGKDYTNSMGLAAGTYVYWRGEYSTACSKYVYSYKHTVTVNPLPVITSLSSATVCYGESATLTATVTGAASYNLNGTDWQTATTFVVKPTATTSYTLYAKTSAGCTASMDNAGIVTVYPAFTSGTITTAGAGTTTGNIPAATISSIADASGGYGNITYEWRRTGTSSETFSVNTPAYAFSNADMTGSTGSWNYTRYAHDEFCNTDWEAAAGTYALVIETEWPAGAGNEVNNVACYTWSGDVAVIACDKSDFKNSTSEADCRSYVISGSTYYYYNYTYVKNNAATLCPSPWRLPKASEANFLLNYVKTASDNDPIFPPVYTGYINGNNVLNNAFWLILALFDDIGGTNQHEIVVTTNRANSYMGTDAQKSNAYSIRCVKENSSCPTNP